MKWLVGILIMLFFLGNVWAYDTFQEAYSAGAVKFNAEDFTGATLDFKEAVTLGASASETGQAQLYVGHSYAKLGDTINAIAEFRKVLDIAEVSTENQAQAWLNIGHRHYYDNRDMVNAKIGYVNVIKLADVTADPKIQALEKLVLLKPDWAELLSLLPAPFTWIDYYSRAIVKEQFADWSGAKADLLEGIKLTDEPENLKMLGQKLEKIKMVLGE